jgi:hypothetical protein
MTGSLTRIPLLEPAAIPTSLLKLARRSRDHVGVDVVVVLWEARQADVVELSAKVVHLLSRVDVLDRRRAQLVDLRTQTGVLGLRVDQAREPVVGVAEGRRDAVCADLEGPQHGRTRALDTVQPPARRLTEVDRDQDE